MTALPDPSEFATTMGLNAKNGLPLHPDIRECYWGYEVRMTQANSRGGVVLRAGAALLSAAFGLLAVAVLVKPAAVLGAFAVAHIAIAFASFSIAVFAAYVFSLQRPVRVQVDRSAGELREVIDRGFLGEAVLTCYSMDTVTAVEVVASDRDPSMGQVHLRVKGNGIVPVGDGAVAALRPLRDTLAVECGLDTDNARPAVWSGPLDR